MAAERARKRAALLAATERELDKITASVNNPRGRLHGASAADIGRRAGAVVNKHKMAKHFELHGLAAPRSVGSCYVGIPALLQEPAIAPASYVAVRPGKGHTDVETGEGHLVADLSAPTPDVTNSDREMAWNCPEPKRWTIENDYDDCNGYAVVETDRHDAFEQIALIVIGALIALVMESVVVALHRGKGHSDLEAGEGHLVADLSAPTPDVTDSDSKMAWNRPEPKRWTIENDYDDCNGYTVVETDWHDAFEPIRLIVIGALITLVAKSVVAWLRGSRG